jgi:putative effector of murein hydrolase
MIFNIAIWSGLTIALYAFSRALHLRRPVWWTHPQVLGFALLMAILIATHTNFAAYRQGSAPLIWLLGPAVVAFAVPIYDQRALIVRHWRVLLIAVATGSTISALISWELARALMLSPALRASLMPRSVSAPFAMIIAARIGGVPGLAATFTAITGLLGATIAAPLARVLGIHSKFARGTMLGMGAHGTGTARAFLWGPEEGTIAATTMVLAGLSNVLVAVIWQSL